MSNFIEFLNKNNIITTIVAVVMSDRINELTHTFVDTLLMPIINHEKIDSSQKLEDFSIVYNGFKIKVGRFVTVLIKFIIIIFIVYMLSIIFKY